MPSWSTTSSREGGLVLLIGHFWGKLPVCNSPDCPQGETRAVSGRLSIATGSAVERRRRSGSSPIAGRAWAESLDCVDQDNADRLFDEAELIVRTRAELLELRGEIPGIT